MNQDVNNFKNKLQLIGNGIKNNALYDWDIVILIIPILSIMIATIMVLSSIDLSGFVLINLERQPPCGITLYINTMFVILAFAIPPFLFAILIKTFVNYLRRKFFIINLDPCIFTKRNTALITAILLPFILNSPFQICDFITDFLHTFKPFSISQTIIYGVAQIPFLNENILYQFCGAFTFLSLLLLHLIIYKIFSVVYKILDKHYSGNNFNKTLRHFSRSSFLTWLLPFTLSLIAVMIFYLIM